MLFHCAWPLLGWGFTEVLWPLPAPTSHPTCSFPVLNMHVGCFCSISCSFCLVEQMECGTHWPLAQTCALEPGGDISCLGPMRLTVWSRCHTHYSPCPCHPQSCQNGTGASLALCCVCLDTPVDLTIPILDPTGGEPLSSSRLPMPCLTDHTAIGSQCKCWVSRRLCHPHQAGVLYSMHYNVVLPPGFLLESSSSTVYLR